MRSNWFKYVFIIVVIIIIVFAVFKIRIDEQQNEYQNNETSNVQKEKVKEIKLGMTQLDTMNPILSNNKNIQDISKLIFDPLVTLSSDYKAEPCLATEWAKQGTSYIIKLRENVKWSDGMTFTAEDVKFTIDRLKDTQTIYSNNVQNVVGIDIVDDYTVRINLDKEVPFFEYNLTFPILSKQYYDAQDFVNTEKNTAPVGTGKYKISEVTASYITLEKNQYWWDKDVDLTLEKITINIYSSIGELYNSFKTGNIDLVSTSNENVQDYIGTIGYSIKEMKGREHTFIALNTQNSFLARQEVRKAISYSIDKQNIVSSIFANKYYTSSFPLDFGSWLCQEEDASAGYNVEQAKQILVDNGWTYRNQYWQKVENYRTQRIVLNLLVKASDANDVAVAQNIKTQLENQGIRINIVQASDEQYQSSLQTKNYDMVICTTYVSPSPNLDTYFGENNLANYSNEEVNNIRNEVMNTTDENVIQEKYKRLIEIYKTDIPYISLYFNKYTVAYSSEIAGDINPNWFYQFYGIEGWYK